MHYIKDIVEGKNTEAAHNKLLRYSKGDFVGPLLRIKVSKNDLKVNGSFHFVDEFLDIVSRVLGDKVVHVGGSVVWNRDLTEEFGKLGVRHSKVSKSRGIFKYVLDNEINVKDFFDSMGKFNLLLTIKQPDVALVTKSTFPKPNKEISNDFCKCVFPLSYKDLILDEFAFDVKDKDFKEVYIEHRILIDDILLPKDAPDFETARRLATRKGKLIRKVTIDNGNTVETEFEFNV